MNFTILMIFLAISVVWLIFPHMFRGRKSGENIARAKERADERVRANAFADTQPMNDPYSSSLELSAAMSATEVDERAIGHGNLTDEQKEIISLIFDGYGMPITKEQKRTSGRSAEASVGVPWSQSIFSEDNVIETIHVDDIWKNVRE